MLLRSESESIAGKVGKENASSSTPTIVLVQQAAEAATTTKEYYGFGFQKFASGDASHHNQS